MQEKLKFISDTGLGNPAKIYDTHVLNRVVGINKMTYIVDKLTGPVEFKELKAAINDYNSDPISFGFHITDIDKKNSEFDMMLFCKEELPFPADIHFLYGTADKIRIIMSMLSDGEIELASLSFSDELFGFPKYYLFAPQLMDDFRFEIHRIMYFIQELMLNKNFGDAVGEMKNLKKAIDSYLDPYLNHEPHEDGILSYCYMMTDSVVERMCQS